MLIKFKIKHPKKFKFLKEGIVFLLIFIITFGITFTIFNGRAFYNQVKYALRVGIEQTEEFLKTLPISKDNLYDIPNSLVLPKININAPIVFADTTNSKIIFNKLEQGVVHYPNSVVPGQIGNTVLLGHSSAYPWYKGNYGSVFALLNRLEQNDEIIVFYEKHKYIYKVQSKEVINNQVYISEQNKKSQIILLSCWPVGTAWKRILIKGVLTR